MLTRNRNKSGRFRKKRIDTGISRPIRFFKEKLFCPITKKEEKQIIVKSSDDGIVLKCVGCGKVRGYEIGYFAEVYK